MFSQELQISLLVLFCALLASLGQIFFKMGSETFELSIKSIFTNIKFIIGATLYASSAILFVYSLKFGELSTLYPIIATSYIWVLIFSNIFFEESITLMKSAGVFFILLGVILIRIV